MTSLVDRLDALRPHLLADDVRAARDRRIPSSTITALREAGAHRMLTPSRLGGEPVDFATVIDAIEAVGRGSGAAAWNLATTSAAALMVGNLSDDGVNEIYAEGPDVAFAGSALPAGQIRKVEGGFEVDGRWIFGSGCLDASWFAAACIEGSTPPRIRSALMPARDIAIDETWDTIGLAGTGSNDWRAERVFVPEHRSADGRPWAPWAGSDIAFPFAWFAAVHFTAVATGLARRAIDELVALASAKKPTGSGSLLRERPGVEDAVGRATAKLESARTYRSSVIASCWETRVCDEPPTEEQGVLLRLAGTAAVESSVAVVESMYRAAGTTAIHVGSPIGAAMRDIEVLAQGITVLPINFALAGRMFLSG